MNDGSHTPEEAHKRTLERLRRMSQAERVQRLKDIGILTPEGTLSARYGGEEQGGGAEAPKAGGSAAK